MSIRLMTDILDGGALDLTLAQRFLLVILADFADDDGTCWPKVSTLAKRLNVKERQTQKHLATLQQKGYIEIVQKSKGHSSNVYRIRGVSNDTCRKVHLSKSTPVREDTPRPVREDTPPIVYKEPSVEPPIPPNPQGGSKQKRAVRLPDDFQFDLQYPKSQSLDPDVALELFTDWAKSKGKTYVDWNLAWKNACRTWLPEQVARFLANRVNTRQEPQPPELFEPVGWQEAARKYPEDTQQRIFGNGDTWEDVPEELKGYLIEDCNND